MLFLAVQWFNLQRQMFNKKQKRRKWLYQSKTVATPEEISGTKITSPMVGTFYASPSPTAGPFVKEGDSVTEGQTLCIVEAMKLMNEVKSTVSGKVKKILVKDKDGIKKGQTLMIIE